MESIVDSRVYYNVLTICNHKSYAYRCYEDPYPFQQHPAAESYFLQDMGRNIADQMCHAILTNTPDISRSTLEHLSLYVDLCKELEHCPEDLAEWILEPGLKYHVAKNFMNEEESYEYL